MCAAQKCLILAFFAVVIALFAGWADSARAAAPSSQTIVVARATPDAVSSVLPIEEVWAGGVLEALKQKDMFAAEKAIDRLEVLRDEGGFASLSVYSLSLIERGRESLRLGDALTAGFLVRQALRLSPRSVRVIYSALPLVQKTGAGDPVTLLGRMVTGLWGDQGTAVRMANRLILPILLSLAVAMYLCLLMVYSLDLVVVLRRFARDLPLLARGVLAPLLLTLALCLPCLFGMMWSIFLWSLAILVFLPRRKWLGFYSGVVLILWAVFLPIRSNFSLWLGDPAVSVMLSEVSGDFWPGGSSMLPALAKRRPTDGLTHIALALAARRSGRFEEARQALLRAQSSIGEHSWLSSQMGVVEMLGGNYDKAGEHFERAESLGLNSAEFLFNYSKLKYLLIDAVSGLEYFNRAQKVDYELTSRLQKREERLGVKNLSTLADIDMPSFWVWRSALIANTGVMASSDAVSRAVMPQLKPYFMLICGAVLIVFFLLRKDIAHASRIETYYAFYKPSALMLGLMSILPGGGLLATGRPGQAFLMLSMLLLLFSPLVGQLNGFETLLDVSRQWELFYVTVLGLAILFVILSGFSRAEGGK